MKTLLAPAFLGVCLLAALPLRPASAQMPFTGPAISNSGGYGRTAAPALPPPNTAPAAAVPGSAYGSPYGGYPASVLSTESIDPDHKLTRGDRLSYRVVEDRDEVVHPLEVTASGEVDVALVGRVKAANKTVTQLTSDIRSRLEQEYYYHATVVMGLDAVAPRASRGTVYVGGAVKAQGAVELPLDAKMTVSQAIIRAGGFVDFSNQRKVMLIHKSSPAEAVIVDVKAVQEGKPDKAHPDQLLEPDDQIRVPEKGINL